MTNQDLQKQIAEKLKKLDQEKISIEEARVYFSGSKTLLSSVALDLKVAKMVGRDLKPETKDYFGIQEEERQDDF